MIEDRGEGFREFGVQEAEAGVEGGGGDEPLAVEEHFGHAAGEETEGEGGDWEDGGAVDGGGEGGGELGVGDCAGGGGVDGAVEGGVFCGEEEEPGEVVDVDPWGPLTAVAETAAEGETEDGGEDGGGTAVGAEDHAGAEGDGAGDGGGLSGGGFPAAADLGEEAFAVRGGFGERGVALVAVEAGAGGGDEDGGAAVVLDGSGEGGGVGGSGVADAVFAGRGPDAHEGFAGEVDDGVEA